MEQRDPAIQELVAVERMWRNLQTNVLALAAYVPAAVVGSPLAAGLIAAGWFMKTRRAAISDLIDDPPRNDYEILTVPRAPRFRLDALGGSNLEIALREFGEPTLLATGEIGAMVRAFERMQGAALDENGEWVRTQQGEFNRFRGWAVEHLAAAADAGPVFGEQVALAAQDIRFGNGPRLGGQLRDVLSSETLADLYNWDIPRSFLERSIEIETPPELGSVVEGLIFDLPRAEERTTEALPSI